MLDCNVWTEVYVHFPSGGHNLLEFLLHLHQDLRVSEDGNMETRLSDLSVKHIYCTCLCEMKEIPTFSVLHYYYY